MTPQRWIVTLLLLAAARRRRSRRALTPQPGILWPRSSSGSSAQGIKICVDTLVQVDVDDAFRGRVFSLYDVIFNVVFVAAAAVGALVIPTTASRTPCSPPSASATPPPPPGTPASPAASAPAARPGSRAATDRAARGRDRVRPAATHHSSELGGGLLGGHRALGRCGARAGSGTPCRPAGRARCRGSP